jgi:methylmalonyl-CoA mutase N-terminal domain/subunit
MFHVEEDDSSRQLLRVDPSVGGNQVKKLSAMKDGRDNVRVKETIEEIRKTAQGSENLIPKILDAVHAYATEGEICGVLREVFGEYKENVVL